MSRPLTVPICLFALVLSGPAFADGWDSTFTADGVASYIEPESAVVVVAAGGRRAELKAPAAALIEALRNSGQTKLVMDQKGVGRVAKLDDEAIVKRCAKLPIDTVAVLRLFPGSSDGEPTAVVTFYGKGGEAQSALSAARGTPLAANKKAPESAALGVSSEAAEAVAGIAKQQTATSKEARESYEKKVVWFEDVIAVNDAGQQVNQWTNVYRGKYKEPLGPEEFYQEVGREDLAQEFRSNSAVRDTFFIPGSVLAATGLVAVAFCWVPILLEDQIGEPNVIPGILGLGVGGSAAMLGGLGLSMVGGFFPLHPVTPSEARELADVHNKQLRQDLGVVED